MTTTPRTGADLSRRGVPLTAEQMAARSRRRGSWAVSRWYFTQARSFRWSILAYSVGAPLLYLLAMGLGLGSLVDSNQQVDGVAYLFFVTPALMVTTTALSVTGELTYPVMDGFRWQRIYEGPAATPVSPGQIALGHHLGVMTRMLLQASMFWLMGLVFGAFPHPVASLVSIPVTALTASAIGAPLQAYAASVQDDDNAFTLIERFVIMPMTLFAGTYFPLDVMPMYLRWIGWLSPIWHGTELARDVSYGAGEPCWLVAVHLLALIVPAAVGLVVATRVYTRRLVGR